MTTDEGLLAAIWADPHDDVPRLVYADWLDETNTKPNRQRAEFIRVQCALETTDDANEYRRLLRRSEELQKLLHQAMTKDQPKRLKRCHQYLRGFPLLTHDSLLPLDLVPLWELELCGGNAFKNLSHSHVLQRLHRFAVQSDLGNDMFMEIVQTPSLRNLVRLELTFRAINGGDPMFAELDRSPHLTSLRYLSWFGERLTSWGIRELCFGRLAHQLRGLSLQPVRNFATLQWLAESPLRTGLRQLTLNIPDSSEAIVEMLTAYEWNLFQLRLSNAKLTAKDCQRLAEWPSLANVVLLDLSNNSPLDWAGAVALAHSCHLKCRVKCQVFVHEPGIEEVEVRRVKDRLGKVATFHGRFDGTHDTVI